MDLNLKQILNLSPDEIKNSKIEFNMQAGSGGEAFIDKWLQYTETEKVEGLCTECSYWGWYGKKRNFYPKQTVFSFIRLRDNELLLISVAEIIDVPENSRAIVKIVEKYKPFFGRLVIKCKKGNTYSRYVFRLEKYLDKIVVKEILPCIYNGEIFEGYDRVHIPYHRLENILNGKICPTYYEALKNIIGVYCLTDTYTGKLYIGSATGTDGVAQRWGNYLESKHGGNKKLIELYEEKGPEYFKNYFTYTIIEYFGLSYDSSKIIEREQYWKNCLDTIKHGYNDN